MKKIPGGVKDENGIFHSTEKVKAIVSEDIKMSDISLDDLLEKHLLVLYRETKSLLTESVHGKLSKDSSNCMRDNIKLLMDLKKKEKEILDNLSEEDLARLAKE